MEKNKILYFLCVLILPIFTLNAQNAMVSVGGEHEGPNGSVSFSTGQIFYHTLSGIDASVSEGVQQPFEIMQLVEIKNTFSDDIDIIAFPNPTSDMLNLNIKGDINYPLILFLTDLNGKVLRSEDLYSEDYSVSMKGYSSGTYFLKLTNTEQQSKIFKIIKK